MNKTFFAIYFALAIPAFATTIYNDGTFNQADWQSTILTQIGTGDMKFTQGNTTGNPGDFQRVVWNVGFLAPGQNSTARVARFRSDFTWNPATDGPLDTLRFSMDLRNFTSLGFTNSVALAWRPVILQDSLAFSVLSVSLSPTINGNFGTFNWDYTSASNWVNFQDPALKPNFSSTGSTITFGYRVEQSGTCNARVQCEPAAAVDWLDNYRVELTAQESGSTVPEPSTWALVAVGILFTCKYRSKGAISTDR
ncbi:MAG: hypothetical protein NTW74_00245 [Acidobacteria bacterium]|nr:hypothetical protein [Acidobacteriota bacterium]